MPDLIILDLMLPVMTGQEVLRELRSGERTRDIPVIILSARSEETDQVVGFSLGCDDYVTKPFHIKVLLQRIKAIQRRAQGGADPVEAEAAVREVLRLDPHNAQARTNLEALYRNTGRWVEGVLDPPPAGPG